MVGPLYNVVNVSKTYADIYKYGSTVAPISYIYKAISDKSGNIKYEDIYYSDKMDIGNAYWIFCNKDVTMPFEP